MEWMGRDPTGGTSCFCGRHRGVSPKGPRIPRVEPPVSAPTWKVPCVAPKVPSVDQHVPTGTTVCFLGGTRPAACKTKGLPAGHDVLAVTPVGPVPKQRSSSSGHAVGTSKHESPRPKLMTWGGRNRHPCPGSQLARVESNRATATWTSAATDDSSRLPSIRRIRSSPSPA